MPPSMDTIGKQSQHQKYLDAKRQKIEKDKIQIWIVNIQWKGLHVLKNSTKLAFKRWEEVVEL